MFIRLAAVLILVAAPALADVEKAVSGHVLPAVERFVAAGAAETDTCERDRLRAFHADMSDAWMGVSHLRLGPGEAFGPSIAFWPDPKGATQRSLADAIARADEAALAPEVFAKQSVAMRGLFALEMMLYDPVFAEYAADSYSCRLALAIATDLGRQAAAYGADWQAFAMSLRTAGAAGNTLYLSPDEALGALYTQLLTGLEFDRDERVGRPLGTFDRPRPARAEAWRSGRSVRNVTLSLEALRDLARALAPGEIPATEAAFGAALDAAGRIRDPGFQDVTDPQGWLRADALRQRIDAIIPAVTDEIGNPLGLAAGFNAQDGD